MKYFILILIFFFGLCIESKASTFMVLAYMTLNLMAPKTTKHLTLGMKED